MTKSDEMHVAAPGRGRRLIQAALCQLVACVVVFGSNTLLREVLNITVPLPALLLASGLLAAMLGYWRRLPLWWLPVLALFPLAVAAALWLQLPAWVYLLAFALLLSLQRNAARGGVPLYLTNRQTIAALARLLPDRPGLVVADLGSGLGGTLMALARTRPDARFEGIETAPLPFVLSWLRALLVSRVRFTYGDYHRRNLAAYDVVYCFLSPVPMPDLYAKARREMRPGTILISNSFMVPGHPAHEIIDVDDARQTRLHIWRF